MGNIVHLPDERPGKKSIYEIIKKTGRKGYLLIHTRCASMNWKPCDIVRGRGETVIGWIYVDDMIKLLKFFGLNEKAGKRITQASFSWIHENDTI